MNISKVFSFISALQSQDLRVMIPSLVFDYANGLLKAVQNIDKHLEFRNVHTIMTSTIQCHSCFEAQTDKEAAKIVWYPAAKDQCPTCGTANPLAAYRGLYER